MTTGTRFVVENAGCASCGALVREALEEIVAVERVTIDEHADEASVLLAPGSRSTEADVNRVLAQVSQGAGHAYRVRPGSWVAS